MDPADIIAHLRRRPFQALRVHLSDGASYEIRHPENALVAQTDMAIAVEDDDGEIPERMVYCDPWRITRIEPIETPKTKRARRKKKD